MESESLTQPLDNERPGIIARLQFAEEPRPTFLSVASLFTDLLLVHDLAVLLSYPEYAAYKFDSRFWARDGRPIAPAHQLRTLSIVKQSPLDLGLVFLAIGAVWAFVQTIDKVSNWKLNRQKLELDLIKAKQDIARNNQELALKELEIMQKSQSLEQVLRERDAEQIFVQLTTRLAESDIRLLDLELRSTR